MAVGAAAQEAPGGAWRGLAGAPDIWVGACGYDPAQLCAVTAGAGEVLVTGMAPEGPGRWGGGAVRLEASGPVWPGRLRLEPGRLVIEACAGLVCRAQGWVRGE